MINACIKKSVHSCERLTALITSIRYLDSCRAAKMLWSDTRQTGSRGAQKCSFLLAAFSFFVSFWHRNVSVCVVCVKVCVSNSKINYIEFD